MRVWRMPQDSVDGGFISDERLIELMSTVPAELMGHSKADVTALLDEYADAVPETTTPNACWTSSRFLQKTARIW